MLVKKFFFFFLTWRLVNSSSLLLSVINCYSAYLVILPRKLKHDAFLILHKGNLFSQSVHLRYCVFIDFIPGEPESSVCSQTLWVCTVEHNFLRGKIALDRWIRSTLITRLTTQNFLTWGVTSVICLNLVAHCYFVAVPLAVTFHMIAWSVLLTVFYWNTLDGRAEVPQPL